MKNPHDKFFKRSMHILNLAKSFFKDHLSDSVLAVINLESLTLMNTEHVDDRYNTWMSDLLYRVNSARSKHEFMYILVEHQSTQDENIPLRIMQYQLNTMLQHAQQPPRFGIPFVYPVIFYNGKTAYTKELNIFKMFGAFNDIAANYFLGPVQLIDLASVKDDDIKINKRHGPMEFLMKHQKEKDILPYIQRIIPQLKQLGSVEPGKYLQFLLMYVVEVNEVEDTDEFFDSIMSGISQTDAGDFMTILEQLKARAHEQGRDEILREMINSMIQEGFDIDVVSRVTHLDQSDVKELIDDK
jgi:predicted transposase/invertase (TIGR01784 family)